MTTTTQISVVSQAMLDLFNANNATLGFANIYDGDMDLIPSTPSLCVVPSSKTRTLDGAPIRTRVEFAVYILIYHNVIQDVQVNFRQSMVLAEATENVLHQDLSLAGNVTFGMVILTEPGYTVRTKSLLRTTRMTWEGFSENVGPTIT